MMEPVIRDENRVAMILVARFEQARFLLVSFEAVARESGKFCDLDHALLRLKYVPVIVEDGLDVDYPNTSNSLFLKKYCLSFSPILRIMRHGIPIATTFAGISLDTTLPAPITELSPIVTPGSICAPDPIKTFFPI